MIGVPSLLKQKTLLDTHVSRLIVEHRLLRDIMNAPSYSTYEQRCYVTISENILYLFRSDHHMLNFPHDFRETWVLPLKDAPFFYSKTEGTRNLHDLFKQLKGVLNKSWAASCNYDIILLEFWKSFSKAI